MDTKIEYWYGEHEKKARKNDMAYIDSYFDGVSFRQINGMEHGELVMVHLKQFDKEIKKALAATHVCLTEHPQIHTVILHPDNDRAGRISVAALKEIMRDR